MQDISIGEKLLELRAARNLTQREVAEELGVSNRTVSKWETGASEPDLATLGKLSQYYGVTTDYLLGVGQEKPLNTWKKLAEEFQGLSREETVQKLLDLDELTLRLTYHALRDERGGQTVPRTPHKSENLRSEIATSEIYDYLVSTKNVNLSVKLFRTETDFAWLSDPETQRKIAELFLFFDDPDAVRLCRYLLDASCPRIFSAEFAAKHSGVENEKAGALLEAACKISLCRKIEARLKEGESVLYENWGSYKLLVIFTLAYEYLCGDHHYIYQLLNGEKLIGREEEVQK